VATLFVGIADGSGSGKYTVAQMLFEREPESFEIIQVDDFHLRREELPRPNGYPDYDLPESFSFDALVQTVRLFRAECELGARRRPAVRSRFFEQSQRIRARGRCECSWMLSW
jgi:uridine kinase